MCTIVVFARESHDNETDGNSNTLIVRMTTTSMTAGVNDIISVRRIYTYPFFP
jgi:hypothetical protein